MRSAKKVGPNCTEGSSRELPSEGVAARLHSSWVTCARYCGTSLPIYYLVKLMMIFYFEMTDIYKMWKTVRSKASSEINLKKCRKPEETSYYNAKRMMKLLYLIRERHGQETKYHSSLSCNPEAQPACWNTILMMKISLHVDLFSTATIYIIFSNLHIQLRCISMKNKIKYMVS